MGKYFNDYEDPDITNFINTINKEFTEKGTVEVEVMHKLFLGLPDNKRNALIRNMIKEKDFRIEEHPDIYNDAVLISSKAAFFRVLLGMSVFVFFIIMFLLSNTETSAYRGTIGIIETIVKYLKIIFL